MFQIGTDGTGYKLTHSFNGLPNDGANPQGSPFQYGPNFYALTSAGGSANAGTVFQIGLDGGNYNVLHYFLGSAADGAGPAGDLILSGGVFYGTTEEGGIDNEGIVFAFTPVPEPSSLLLLAAGTAASTTLSARARIPSSSNTRRWQAATGSSRILSS